MRVGESMVAVRRASNGCGCGGFCFRVLLLLSLLQCGVCDFCLRRRLPRVLLLDARVRVSLSVRSVRAWCAVHGVGVLVSVCHNHGTSVSDSSLPLCSRLCLQCLLSPPWVRRPSYVLVTAFAVFRGNALWQELWFVEEITDPRWRSLRSLLSTNSVEQSDLDHALCTVRDPVSRSPG